tara:strand:+ start:499 stop:648 length:150 start_codon:yes stop_codon:yes gene_type:complete
MIVNRFTMKRILFLFLFFAVNLLSAQQLVQSDIFEVCLVKSNNPCGLAM